MMGKERLVQGEFLYFLLCLSYHLALHSSYYSIQTFKKKIFSFKDKLMQQMMRIQQKLRVNKMYGFFMLCRLCTTSHQLKHLTFVFKAPQDERPLVELTEEQHERIRKNREFAFEKRQAKRRRLEEESQTR